MRVIAGEQRGMRLQAVKGNTTRPTADKVREALFHRLGPYFDGGIGLDLYGGSGAISIEAISRGMERMHIVELSKEAITTITKNAKHCRVDQRLTIQQGRAQSVLKRLSSERIQFDFIYIDPPYKQQMIEEDIQAIVDGTLLHPDGVIVCEHDSGVTLPKVIESLETVHEKRYRDTTITMYRMSESEE
ncbi:16S rRNA (guanine(966)-N(2))-methyltransferase RsmD [Geomicrobium sp. JCM 19055]|uniref:16S rRNA (guanine(966)-N(2))-methyltransferase RsmD n=1 Tax=Geomicrobium sp. JCM 19055 TaxID=1460649 RepID=UPI0005A8B2A4|nr:16S rRNA (guanine(966)-N(2))-methyltransferase RsmD [Geomicrobium sp. JCM 19055]